MGKVNGLWMDENLDAEQYDVTGEAAMEAMAETEGVPESTHHRFNKTRSFCEKCFRSMREITGDNIGKGFLYCTGTPKAGPMVRVMKGRSG